MKYSLRSLMIVAAVTLGFAFLLFIFFARDYIPGTLYRDQNGVPHGTGIEEFFYDSGQVKGRIWYRFGISTRLTWYRPDGTVVADKTVDTRVGVDDLYLREDGSIERVIPSKFDPKERMFFADGQAVLYDKDGKVAGTVEYRHGVKVEKSQ